MSTRWNPSWKIVKTTIDKEEVDVCYDSSSKLYVCPLCSPECKRGELPTYSSYFFNLEDMKRHMQAHKYELWKKKMTRANETKVEESEDEEIENE
ncbi:hypothetical protein [Sulfuracidifex tepidarius]|uniref:Uncharacterized protein n=1 Tax=Sulfuracidifex tepidarius TaxID=1294262 RepID=A0A510DWH2_9CREN|nr:hypothetical protein [Sulfuracidifex tepidarius]BBG24571.1 hypothetical protein IC006_1898 [Sulfuracidifex tepidarius]BBG27359.1 hypothetical protein IC007_1906 [Sulfuracidifex tepidarius]